jgi:hypothetical protein
MHEQSETVERDGKFYNVYGKNTPKAGQDLPGEKAYKTLNAAVAAAEKRSENYQEVPDAPWIMPELPDAPWISQPEHKTGGAWNAFRTGVERSGTGLLLRGRLPNIELDPHHAKWYENALASVGEIGADIGQTIIGGVAGTIAGTTLGGIAGSSIPVVGNVAGAAGGALLGGGAGMMAVPAAIRESLMHAYENGEADSSSDFLSRVGIMIKGLSETDVMKASGKAALVGMMTLGMGKVAAPLGTIAKLGAEAGTLAVAPAALEGRLPEPWEVMNAAIVLGGMKAAGHVAGKVARIYTKTGREPEQVVVDAKADPTIESELKAQGEDIPSAYKPLAEAEMTHQVIPGEKAEQILDQPYADLPETKLPTQINLKYVEGPDDVKAVLTRMSAVYGEETQVQRGGTQGWAETEQKATAALDDLTGGEAAKVITAREPGTAANAVELKIRGDMLMKASIEAADAARKYNEAKEVGTATDQMKLDALTAIHRASMIQSEFTGAASETARALQYMQKIKELRDQGKRIGELVGMYGRDPDLLLKMAGDVDTPGGMAKFAKDMNKATKWEMVIEAYKAGLIGPISQVANILGNVTFVGTHDVIDLVTAMRPGGEVKLPQVAARIIGQFQGAYEGLKIAADFVGENWTRPMEALRKLDVAPARKMEQHRKAIPGDIGVLVRSMSFPWLSAMDGAFRMIAERGETNSWAAGEALKEGLNPATREFRERMAELAQNIPEERVEKIKDYGTRAVFQERLGPWGQDLQSLLNRTKVGPLFVPFMQTPSNIFKEMARLFPLSAPFVEKWRADFKQGGAARDRAVAEIVVGGSLMAITSALAFDGERITGFGPPEPEKRRTWLETHQPYSAKILGTYYDYSRIQPIGTLIGLAADMSVTWKYMTPDEQDRVPRMISIAFSQAVTNQIWLKGMVDIARGVAESDRYGPKIVQNLAAGMMPGSGWLGQTAQLMDPYQREVGSILDAIRNRIPGAREELQPQISSMTGKPITNKERLGIVSPIKMQDESTDPVLLEAARLGIGVGKAPKTIQLPIPLDKKLGRVELTPEQKTLFSTEAGQFAHQILTQLVGTQMWANIPKNAGGDLLKKKIYSDVFRKARGQGAAAALPGEPRAALAQEMADQLMQKFE